MRLLKFLMILSALGFFSSPLQAEAGLKVGVSVPKATHGWSGAVVWWAKEGIGQLRSKYPEIDFLLVTASTPEQQAADIDLLTQEGIDSLVVLPVSDLNLVEVLGRAQQKGVFIVAVDRVSPSLPQDVLIVADNQSLGRQCGEIMAQALEGRGKIVIMEAFSSINAARVEAFRREIAKYPELQIIDSQNVDWNVLKGQEVMENLLNQHQLIDGIWTGDDSVLLTVKNYYEKSGRQDLKIMLGLGGAKEVIKLIMDEHPLVQATIYYPASIIADGLKVAVEHLMEGREVSPVIPIECPGVDRSNAHNFYAPDSLY